MSTKIQLLLRLKKMLTSKWGMNNAVDKYALEDFREENILVDYRDIFVILGICKKRLQFV